MEKSDYLQEFKVNINDEFYKSLENINSENNGLAINGCDKQLKLGRVGKSIQGKCKIEQGKIFFINRDKTIKTVWED